MDCLKRVDFVNLLTCACSSFLYIESGLRSLVGPREYQTFDFSVQMPGAKAWNLLAWPNGRRPETLQGVGIEAFQCANWTFAAAGYYYNFRNDVIADDPSHIMLLTSAIIANASKAPKRGTVPSTRNLVICSIFHHILFFRANNFQQCSGHRFLGSTLKQHVLKKHFGIFMGNTWKYCQHFYYRRACSKMWNLPGTYQSSL